MKVISKTFHICLTIFSLMYYFFTLPSGPRHTQPGRKSLIALRKTLKVMNKAHDAKRFSLEVSGLYNGKVSDLIEINADPDKVTTIHTHVIAAPVGPPAQQFIMRLIDLDSGKIVEEPAVFRRPAK